MLFIVAVTLNPPNSQSLLLLPHCTYVPDRRLDFLRVGGRNVADPVDKKDESDADESDRDGRAN